MAMAPGAAGGDPSQGAQPGGASQLVADINDKLMQLMDMMKSLPEDQQKLGALIQGYHDFVDGLGQAPGQQPADQQTTTPEQGAAKVQPAM